jgi:hypothetical protein
MSTEGTLHQQVCDYLRLRYAGVLFHTDYAAGVKLTMPQAVRNKRLQSGRAWPDLFIPEPRNGFHGLFVELKKEGTAIVLKDGSLTGNAHIREQAAMLEGLSYRGYAAVFARGFDEARTILDKYLGHGE